MSKEFRQMRWRRSICRIILLTITIVVGCRAASDTHYLGDADLQYYRDKVLSVSHVNVQQMTPPEVSLSQKPRSIHDRSLDDVWEMTLLEAVHTALRNNKMIRTRANSTQMMANPANIASIYDPALGETGYIFGSRGVEAALADFDAQVSAATNWGNNATIQDSFGLFQNNNDTGNFVSNISKTLPTGGNITVNHNWYYQSTNAPPNFVPISTTYTGNTGISYIQPLWAGAGLDYNRVAGPIRPGFGSITGVSQGVSIARINGDIDIADFELSVTQMVKDVEDLYWELYLAYRNFDAEVANRQSAHRSWVEIKAKVDAGGRGGSASDEAQARENYFTTAASMESALSRVLVAENQLRKLLGLAVNDGKIIRPKDDPIEAEFVVDWGTSLLESLTNRVELRRQKWQIKSLELQYKAAQNVANPQLNLVAGYQVNGFGSNLVDYTNGPYNSMYTSMGRGNLTGWNAGLQFSMPLGLRSARMQMHNIELQIVKARAGLSAQEQDIAHELAEAIQKIESSYSVAQAQLNRKIAAVKRVAAAQAMFDAGGRNEQNQGATLDLVLRAQAANAAAEIAYFSALIDYNKAITEFHWRRGMLLDVDGISLSESDWDEKSKRDAMQRAIERSYAFPNNKLDVKPAEFSSPVAYPDLDPYNGNLTLPDAQSPSVAEPARNATEATPAEASDTRIE